MFGPPGQNTINWRLIETHWADLMQVVLSIRQGRLSSTLLLRRLGTESHKNNLYKAFRELGRVIRTVTLLRFISEPDLREEITAATNKVEAYNGFSAWLMFGHDVIERNYPAEQEKIIKFNTLVANCVIFHTAIDMTAVIRQLAAEGCVITAADLTALSPYLTERIKRFGEYATDGLDTPPEAFDPRLAIAGADAAGNVHIRTQLVESAWAYRSRAAVGVELRRRQEGLDPTVVARAWAAQLRLCGRFRRLDERKTNRNIVVTAIARELAGFVWAEMTA